MSIILTINAGSATLKLASFNAESLEGISSLTLKNQEGLERKVKDWAGPYARKIIAIGHRVVHSGDFYKHPTYVNKDVLSNLATLSPLAPLHQPVTLSWIKRFQAWFPQVPNYACFDTHFHRTIPDCHRIYPLPISLTQKGVRRYGFHGLSYQSIVRQLGVMDPELFQGNVIAAHLGNGSSLCALKQGQSFATTMGFTALDGVMMGTRSGTIDPGVIFHLLLQEKFPPQDLQDILYNESGLKGVSGISHDVRELETSPDPRAKEALSLYCHRIIQELCGLAGLLGGIDGIIFSGGIGENSAYVRASILDSLKFLGCFYRSEANQNNKPHLHLKESKIRVYIIHTNEEQEIAYAYKEARS